MYRDVLASPEFRAVYFASTLSWIGDATGRAAITALVFQMTGSAAWSAGAFAITYAPWLLGGSLLVALAERYPHRTVMVTCDLARVAIMGCIAIPGIPLPVVLGLVLLSAFFAPPFDAARSANAPALLSGERYVLGLALHSATNQPAQVAGYLLGAALSIHEPRLAFAINAVSFALSAALLRFGLRRREPSLAHAERTDLLHETGDGFRVVFGTPALRAIALLVFGGVLFVALPEGLGAAWAGELTTGADQGWTQGVIMASVPLGSILGSVVITRLVSPDLLVRLMRPLAIAVPLTLVPAVFAPSAPLVAVLSCLCGMAMGALGPVANGQFVRRLPTQYRARAFGVIQAGVHLLQGVSVLATGALAQRFSVPAVVGVWSLLGVGMMIIVVVQSHAGAALATPPSAPSGPSVPAQANPPDLEDDTTADLTASRTTVARHRRPAPAGPPGTMES